MSRDELRHELDEGIEMWGYEENGELTGVMGIQHRQNVTLIRHAYVSTSRQNQGIGGKHKWTDKCREGWAPDTAINKVEQFLHHP